MPGQEAGGDVHGEDPQGGDGGREGQEPGSLVCLTDLSHIDLDTEHVPPSSTAGQEPAPHQHAQVGGGGHHQPAQQVHHRQRHQAESPAVVMAQEGGQGSSQYCTHTEHVNWKY